MREGFPIIAGHILSNFYNDTRDKYYKCFDICREKKDLGTFLRYAIEGLRDGLNETYESVIQSQIGVFWQRVIYDTFDGMAKTKATVRKRVLMLNFPLDQGILLSEMPKRTGTLDYAKVSPNTLYKDVKDLIKEELLYQTDKRYYANYKKVCQMYFTPSKVQ